LEVARNTAVLKRVLFLTSSALLTSSPVEMHVETMGIPGHPTQRVEKETGLDSMLSFILM